MNGRDSYIRCVFMLAEGMGCRLHECLRLLGRRALPDSNDDEIERDTCDLKALTRAVDISANSNAFDKEEEAYNIGNAVVCV